MRNNMYDLNDPLNSQIKELSQQNAIRDDQLPPRPAPKKSMGERKLSAADLPYSNYWINYTLRDAFAALQAGETQETKITEITVNLSGKAAQTLGLTGPRKANSFSNLISKKMATLGVGKIMPSYLVVAEYGKNDTPHLHIVGLLATADQNTLKAALKQLAAKTNIYAGSAVRISQHWYREIRAGAYRSSKQECLIASIVKTKARAYQARLRGENPQHLALNCQITGADTVKFKGGITVGFTDYLAKENSLNRKKLGCQPYTISAALKAEMKAMQKGSK